MNTPFMFATGIENSYPTIHGGKTRVDEMEKCRHYEGVNRVEHNHLALNQPH